MMEAGAPRGSVAAAGPGHAGLLAALHAEAFSPEERWDETAFAVQLHLLGTMALLGTHGDAMAEPGGFVLFRSVFEESEILTLAVVPGYRRRGLGFLLMRAAMARAQAQGAETMLLEVETTNQPARALYERLGFVRIGLRRQYYHGGGDALVMRAPLAGPGFIAAG